MRNLEVADQICRLLEKLVNGILKLERRFTAPIICLCGSTRFKCAYIDWYGRLTDEGNIVLSVDRFIPKRDHDKELKKKLDELHKRKIDLCDSVFVLDVGGYVGESTKSEIEYAKGLVKPIKYLSEEYPSYVEPVNVDGLVEEFIKPPHRCHLCDGTGKKWNFNQLIICPACSGTGKVPIRNES